MSQLNEARKVAIELLDSLEILQTPIDTVLMKAIRLARLMRDTDAQTWLNFEVRGYPYKFNNNKLGTCKKYALLSGRILGDGKYYVHSLPYFEAQGKSNEATIESIRTSRAIDSKVKDFTEKNATVALMASQLNIQKTQKKSYVENKALFSSLKSGIHSYVTDVFLAIEFGDIAQDIFEQARQQMDNFIRENCPKAVEQLLAINDRIREDLGESRAVALTSCRRLLMSVADSLFPSQDEPRIDLKGKKRKVGTEEYKNRLLAFIEDNLVCDSSISIIMTEIEHLASRLDAVYAKTCKGIHADVTKEEARLCVIHTYLFLGEIARISNSKNKGVNND